MEIFEIGGLEVEVERKRIKNAHLYVHPPYGNISVSAPLKMSRGEIEHFVLANLSWIEKQQAKFQSQKRTVHRYLNGEELSLWGKAYQLTIIPSASKSVILSGDDLLLLIAENSSFEEKEKMINSWYKRQLEPVITEVGKKWDAVMGVQASAYTIRNMKSRWGSCNTATKKICINLQLVKKPPECLEYVIVHELCHLLEASHNQVFKAYMDQYLPTWRETKSELNRQAIGTF